MSGIMIHTDYGCAIQRLDTLVSTWYYFLKSEKCTKISVDKIRKNAVNGEHLLSYFEGIDSELATMVGSCKDYTSLGQISLEEIFSKLAKLKSQLDELEALIKEVASFHLTADVHNKELICTCARALILFCKKDLKCQYIDDKTTEISNSKKDLENLLIYLKSDKAQLDYEISEIKKLITKLSAYADRFGCRNTLNKTRSILQAIPSGNQGNRIKIWAVSN